MDEGPHLDASLALDGALLLDGEIDTYTVPELEEAMAELPDVCVVDLTDVGFIDSSGLRVIVAAHDQRLERGGKVILRSPNPNVQQVLDISGVAEHLDIVQGEPPTSITPL